MGRLGWLALNALQLVVTVLVTAAGFPVALAIALVAGPGRALRMASWYWAPIMLGGAGAQLVVEGAERVDWSRPHVLVANHASMIDIAVLFRAVPVPLRFLLKAELAKLPVIGGYARAMGMVFIERGNARAAHRRLADAVALLRGGATLVAFPEGTRSKDGTIGPFKGGAFQLAIEAGVPVVPVHIAGSDAILPPAGFRVRPGTIRLRFGTPIQTQDLQERDRVALAQQARAAVIALA